MENFVVITIILFVCHSFDLILVFPQTSLQAGVSAVELAQLLPGLWANFLRSPSQKNTEI